MKPGARSNESAGAAPARTYAKGDRVRVLATGALGTVTYACESHRGHFVTVHVDGAAKPRTLTARELARVESLF